MKRVPVGFGIDRHRLNPQLLAGADYPQGDFTAIGNQDFLKHCAEQKLENRKWKLETGKLKLETERWKPPKLLGGWFQSSQFHVQGPTKS